LLDNIITLQTGELSPLFVATQIDLEADKLKLFIYKNGWIDTDAVFEPAGDRLYKTSLQFDEKGYRQIKVTYENQIVAEGLLHITDTLKTLIDVQMGNWEIKNKQMIFYKVDGSELMRFDLYDKDGNKTTFGVVKRVRV